MDRFDFLYCWRTQRFYQDQDVKERALKKISGNQEVLAICNEMCSKQDAPKANLKSFEGTKLTPQQKVLLWQLTSQSEFDNLGETLDQDSPKPVSPPFTPLHPSGENVYQEKQDSQTPAPYQPGLIAPSNIPPTSQAGL